MMLTKENIFDIMRLFEHRKVDIAWYKKLENSDFVRL